MSETEDTLPVAGVRIGVARLALGLAQGLALYALSEAWTRVAWPSTDPALFAALVFALLFAPVVVLGGLGRMRPAVLAGLAMAMAAAAFWFGWHAIARQPVPTGPGLHRPTPDFPPVAAAAVFVFIGHHLTQPADAARRWIAPHAAYFDTAWKNAVQLALAAGFVAILWGGLVLGAALFDLIGLKGFGQLIEKRWFSFPVTAAAFAAAIQLTDVRDGLIRGVRTVGLMLLSWLLPLMTVIAVAFLVALPFTGLKPLFATKSAAATLLAAAAGLIVLINATYQEGDVGKTPALLRLATRIAAVCLVPLIAIAGFALALRVGQYGWTPERVTAAAACLVGTGYAGGYAAAVPPLFGPRMRLIERVNVVMAMAALLALLGLFTPIADPARLSVSDQVARLMDGRTAPDKFDYAFLRTKAGRYGQTALADLRRLRPATPRLADIAGRAEKAATENTLGQPMVPENRSFAARLTLYPAGATAPPDLVAAVDRQDPQLISWVRLDDCAPPETGACALFVLDVDGDGQPEALLTPAIDANADSVSLEVFKKGDAGWRRIGNMVVLCRDGVEALKRGEVAVRHTDVTELEVAGRPFRLQPDQPTCPPSAPPPVAAAPTPR